MRSYLYLLFILLPFQLFTQSENPTETPDSIVFCKEIQEDHITAPVTFPEYPGGMKALRQELQTQTDIPRKLKNIKNLKIVIRFQVLKDGSIGKTKVLRDDTDCKPCIQSCIDAIYNLKYKFKPGTTNGKPHDVWLTFPFVLIA